MIKNIIFDIGMVLVDFRYRKYMEDLGFSPEAISAITEKIVENELWSKLDLGVENKDEVIAQMKGRVPEYKEECDKFFENIVDIVKTFDYTVPWIKALKAEGYRVYLLSNYPDWLFELHERERFGFTHLVDGRVVSGFEKMVKPSKEIYELLLNRYGLKPEESLFIDDREVNVRAALKAGMQSFVFTSYEEANDLIHKPAT